MALKGRGEWVVLHDCFRVSVFSGKLFGHGGEMGPGQGGKIVR